MLCYIILDLPIELQVLPHGEEVEEGVELRAVADEAAHGVQLLFDVLAI